MLLLMCSFRSSTELILTMVCQMLENVEMVSLRPRASSRTLSACLPKLLKPTQL